MKLYKNATRVSAFVLALVVFSSAPTFADNGNGTEPPKQPGDKADKTEPTTTEENKPSTLCNVLPLVCDALELLGDNGNGNEPES